MADECQVVPLLDQERRLTLVVLAARVEPERDLPVVGGRQFLDVHKRFQYLVRTKDHSASNITNEMLHQRQPDSCWG
jgi:hypothetical protein